MTTRSKAVTGNAGEYYVAFLLSKEGYAVGLTGRGTPHVDLLATKTSTGKSVVVQVKTMRKAYTTREGGYWHWRVSEGALDNAPHNVYWAFVDLQEDSEESTPNVYFLRSAEIKRSPTEDPGWINGWFWFDRQWEAQHRNNFQALREQLE